MTDSTLPSLDAIQARADARRDYPDERPESLHVPEDYAALADESAADVPVLVAALRAVLDLHRPETPRRDPDFHHTDRVCIECGDTFPCRTYTAITAHIDTTPKETP